MTDSRRLIEVAFPLKQASLDSVHEKNVRHGHISTLHIWPARRPLAACRAALIATLLPDPGNKEERDKILEKLGGKVVKVVRPKKLPSGKVEEKIVEETVGGILHWGRESNPDLEWFRQKIREAYGGQAPKVLDPFAGGGAIPLEAMRLGCEVTALDISPVAWFILKCTLEYPQQLSGQHRPLPKFAVESRDFMEQFFKGTGKLTKKQLERNLDAVQHRLFPPPDVDLSWHVRAWGWWILERAKENMGPVYSSVDGKAVAAYLWARTVRCKGCRALIPLLKTRWLCKKENKRRLLTMEPNTDKSGVIFGIEQDPPKIRGNAAQRREYDKELGAGTMSRSGVSCPCCKGTIMTMEELRTEGVAERIGAVMTAIVLEGDDGKEYCIPTADQLKPATEIELDVLYRSIPYGMPSEPLPKKETLGFRVPLYGLDAWHKLFTQRQLFSIGTFIKSTSEARREMRLHGYPEEWLEAVSAFLSLAVDRLANRSSSLCIWNMPAEKIEQTFARFALPMLWDYAESNPLSSASGNYQGEIDWLGLVCERLSKTGGGKSSVLCQSAMDGLANQFDAVVTDPPYYDAIPYSDLMDFFYIWLRRSLSGLSPGIDEHFRTELGPKWDHAKQRGELIDDSSRFGGDAVASRASYERGMEQAFRRSYEVLKNDGRLVVVFAHKNPEAWETLVSAIIRAGFVVDASWPIQTERTGRMRANASAALASSIWLVCKKRATTSTGWDATVLTEMATRIQTRLREFWDAGIRGPDFVWAATGPALEAYSQYPVVKKANSPGELMSVSEFLKHVRRLVVDFVVGQVLTQSGAEAVSGLDDVTTYYILHRYDFQMDESPIGACILYAISCGLTDRELTDRYDLLVRTGGQDSDEDDEAVEEGEDEPEEIGASSGSKVRLKPWNQRFRKNLGLESENRTAPMIDQAHRLMHLWKTGDVIKVDEYLDTRALRSNRLFAQLLQALIELASAGSEERSVLESLSNHLKSRGEAQEQKQPRLQHT